MTADTVQPWGMPPTPLVPKPLRSELGYLYVPQSLGTENSDKLRLAELDASLWERVDSVSSVSLLMLTNFLRTHYNRFRYLCIYSSELPTQSLETLPFSTRTRDAVLANTKKFSAPSLTFEEAMSINSLGFESVIEFACVVEAAKTDIRDSGYRVHSYQRSPGIEQRISCFFEMLAAWALGEQKIESLSQVLPTPLPEWPVEIKQLWSGLGEVSTNKLAGKLVKNYTVSDLVSKGIGTIDEQSKTIALERIITVGKYTKLEELGERLGISMERVRQIEQNLLLQFECFESEEFSPVTARAQFLRESIGSAVPNQHRSIKEELNRAMEDFPIDDNIRLVGGLLLWLAGPYRVHQNWLLLDNALPERTIDALLGIRGEKGVIPKECVTIILNDLGIRQEHHNSWIEHLKKLHQVEEGFLYCYGSTLEKAKVFMKYCERPVSANEVVDFIGSGSVSSVRQRLIEDPRFWRVNKQNEFVLAGTDGYENDTDIKSGIFQELKSNGGPTPSSLIVEKSLHDFGVNKESVIARLNTSKFISDEHKMERARVDRFIREFPAISKAASCYKTVSSSWCWRVQIDKNIERGSVHNIPIAFAQLLGCDVSNRVEISTECGPITLSWPSKTGPTIGSLHPAMMHCEAKIGDYLFVVASKPKVRFKSLDNQEVKNRSSNLVRLALLLGYECLDYEEQAIAGIATALGVTASSREAILTQSYQILNSRGETELANLIPTPNFTLDQYMEDIGRLFG